MIKTIKLIQFHNWAYDSDDRLEKNMIGKWFFLDEEDMYYEFYDGDDDNGEPIYNEKVCIKYFDTMDDYLDDDNAGYVQSRRLKYKVIEIDVDYDEISETINWQIA